MATAETALNRIADPNCLTELLRRLHGPTRAAIFQATAAYQPEVVRDAAESVRPRRRPRPTSTSSRSASPIRHPPDRLDGGCLPRRSGRAALACELVGYHVHEVVDGHVEA